MAKAPRPGSTHDDDEQLITVTVRGATRKNGSPIPETHAFSLDSLPFEERMMFRQATGGLAIEMVVRSPGLDTVPALWWMARRANGERKLGLGDVAKEWDRLTPIDDDDWDLDFGGSDDEDSDNPEESGADS